MKRAKIAGTAGRFAAALALLFTAAAELRAEDGLEGFWIDSDGEVILEVRPCGEAKCAHVAWLRLPNGPDGKPLLDYRNPDPALQTRPVCGLEVISGFKKQPDGTWGDGTVYVSDLGHSFSGYAEVLSPTQVKVRGYVLLPIFGESEVWTRVTTPFDHCVMGKTNPSPPQQGAGAPSKADPKVEAKQK
jgi:uncharacterized protein (DUF2147 family)